MYVNDTYRDIQRKNMLSINYLPHRRPEFHKLMFYFMGKIKPENKQKIKLNILTTGENKQQFSNPPKDIKAVTTCFSDDNNYMQKIEFATKQKETYSIKLDEDIFFSNYVWDFIIENMDKLDDAMFMSPILSTGVSFIDDYMARLFSDDERKAVEAEFLKVKFTISLGADYRPLNKHTIEASEWKPKDYWQTVKNEVKHAYKGVHPIRFSLEAHRLINEFTMNHLDEIFSYGDFEIESKDLVYFTNSFFAIRTDRWRTAIDRKDLFVDEFDEVPVNRLMNESGLPALVIKNGFAIHPFYNFVSKLMPRCETNFYNSIVQRVINNV